MLIYNRRKKRNVVKILSFLNRIYFVTQQSSCQIGPPRDSEKCHIHGWMQPKLGLGYSYFHYKLFCWRHTLSASVFCTFLLTLMKKYGGHETTCWGWGGGVRGESRHCKETIFHLANFAHRSCEIWQKVNATSLSSSTPLTFLRQR